MYHVQFVCPTQEYYNAVMRTKFSLYIEQQSYLIRHTSVQIVIAQRTLLTHLKVFSLSHTSNRRGHLSTRSLSGGPRPGGGAFV